MRCSWERESHLINQIFIQRKSPCSTLYKECQGWSKEIFYIVISGFVGCFGAGASSYFLSCINSRLVSEKTLAESGVNVRMFSEIYRDVFLFFVQKIKTFVQKINRNSEDFSFTCKVLLPVVLFFICWHYIEILRMK